MLIKAFYSRSNLWEAWKDVQENARDSESSTTKEAVKDFANGVPRNLHSIQAKLVHGTYQFEVPRPVPVERPGKDPRPLLVRPVADRVVERALLRTLQNQRDIRLLVEGGSSYGAIPGRGVRDGIKAVVDAIGNDATHYVRSDIGGFFQHIPRPQVIARIESLLPDDSLIPLLDQATEVDRRAFKAQDVGRYRRLFPTSEEGVAQGGSLSAFFGNVAMEEFDQLMSGDRAVTVRYVDDFITLAPSLDLAMARFDQGSELLSQMDMEVYPPDGRNPEKAAKGETRTFFEFLGCEISSSFVRPGPRARDRLLEKVQDRLNRALADLRSGKVAEGARPKSSIVRTLYDVNNVVRSWSGSYSFCNADQALRTLDRKVHGEVIRFLGEAGRIRTRTSKEDETMGRRVLGIFPAADGKKNPLYGGE